MTRFLNLILLGKLAVAIDPTFVFPSIRKGEPLCFSGHHGDEFDETPVKYSLKNKNGNLLALNGCKVTKNYYMANGDFLPLSAQRHLPSMVSFEIKSRISIKYSMRTYLFF